MAERMYRAHPAYFIDRNMTWPKWGNAVSLTHAVEKLPRKGQALTVGVGESTSRTHATSPLWLNEKSIEVSHWLGPGIESFWLFFFFHRGSYPERKGLNCQYFLLLLDQDQDACRETGNAEENPTAAWSYSSPSQPSMAIPESPAQAGKHRLQETWRCLRLLWGL